MSWVLTSPSVQFNTCTSISHYQLLPLTLSCALTSAPASSSVCTTRRWPPSLAKWRGVICHCKTHLGELFITLQYCVHAWSLHVYFATVPQKAGIVFIDGTKIHVQERSALLWGELIGINLEDRLLCNFGNSLPLLYIHTLRCRPISFRLLFYSMSLSHLPLYI